MPREMMGNSYENIISQIYQQMTSLTPVISHPSVPFALNTLEANYISTVSPLQPLSAALEGNDSLVGLNAVTLVRGKQQQSAGTH